MLWVFSSVSAEWWFTFGSRPFWLKVVFPHSLLLAQWFGIGAFTWASLVCLVAEHSHMRVAMRRPSFWCAECVFRVSIWPSVETKSHSLLYFCSKFLKNWFSGRFRDIPKTSRNLFGIFTGIPKTSRNNSGHPENIPKKTSTIS